MLSSVFARRARRSSTSTSTRTRSARTSGVDLGLVSDPKLTLAALADALERHDDREPTATPPARARAGLAARKGAARRRACARRTSTARREVPLHASEFMEELAARLPADAIVFDEA